jgi:hypothetical protein
MHLDRNQILPADAGTQIRLLKKGPYLLLNLFDFFVSACADESHFRFQGFELTPFKTIQLNLGISDLKCKDGITYEKGRGKKKKLHGNPCLLDSL